MSSQAKSDPAILTGSKRGSWSQTLSSLSQKTKILTNNVITRKFGKYSFKGKPFVIFLNMKIPENLNENTPPKDFPLKSKGKM